MLTQTLTLIVLCTLGLPATGLSHFRRHDDTSVAKGPDRSVVIGPTGVALSAGAAYRLGIRQQQRSDTLPIRLNYFASVVQQDDLYIIGGNGEEYSRFAEVSVFDGRNWSRAPPMRVMRDDFGAAVFRGQLHVAGGFDDFALDSLGETRSMEVFDGTRWAFGPPMAQTRASFGLVAYKDKLYAVGGYLNERALDSVEFYDGEVWQWGPSMPAPTWAVAAVAFQDRLVVLGGAHNFETDSATNAVMMFDGDAWSFGPPMPISRNYMGAAVFQDKLYAMGGAHTCCNYQSAASNAVVIFDGVGWAWGQPMQERRTCFRAEVFRGRLLAMGGGIGPAMLDSIEIVAGPQRNITLRG